jgi:hypothetical protein
MKTRWNKYVRDVMPSQIVEDPSLALSEQARRFAMLAGGGTSHPADPADPAALAAAALSSRILDQARVDLRGLDRHIVSVQQEQSAAKETLDRRIKSGNYSVEDIRRMHGANDVYSEDILGLIDRRHIAIERLQQALAADTKHRELPGGSKIRVQVGNAIAQLSHRLETRVNNTNSAWWRLNDTVERRRRLAKLSAADGAYAAVERERQAMSGRVIRSLADITSRYDDMLHNISRDTDILLKEIPHDFRPLSTYAEFWKQNLTNEKAKCRKDVMKILDV